MRPIPVLFATVLGAFLATSPAFTARAAGEGPPLVLQATIPLPGVRGRIDHMAVDLARRRLIVAELGNDTVDVVDLPARRVAHRIAGLKQPQGVGYAPGADVVAVADAGDGVVHLFAGAGLAPAGTVPLDGDADNVRIDPRSGAIVVGYGEGGLAVIDPVRRAEVAAIRLPAHPESFRIDPVSGRTYVNLPDADRIAAVDLPARRVVANWKRAQPSGNFPMALDPSAGLLAVVFRNPPTLLLLDEASGAVRARVATCGDADDVFFDHRRARLYISCGSGEVASFGWDGHALRSLPRVLTAPGARTSLFVPALDLLFVARRAVPLGDAAAILVFRPVP